MPETEIPPVSRGYFYYLRSVILRLQSEHFGVFAVREKKLLVAALFDQTSRIEHIYLVRDTRGGEAVRDKYHRLVLGLVKYRLIEIVLCHRVERA